MVALREWAARCILPKGGMFADVRMLTAAGLERRIVSRLVAVRGG
jgi:hypothetical protein